MSVTAAIIQARLASTRLPGKVLLPIGDQTLLGRCLARARFVPGVDVLCVATVPGADGERIGAEARRYGAEVFVGSESDVLQRYAGAAHKLGADIVLRITSDCPFIDPGLAGEVLALCASGQADFATNNAPPRFPHGLDCEAFTTPWLLRASREATSALEREHVGPFMRAHPEARRLSLVAPADGFAIAQRWTVDRQEDLAFARAAQSLLDAAQSDMSYETLLSLLRTRPDITAINAHLVDRARLSAPAAGFHAVMRNVQPGESAARREGA